MNLLLDSHIFIWMHNEPNKLSTKAAMEIVVLSNTLFLSIASIWEIQIKTQIGKLQLSIPLAELVKRQRQANMIEILPVSLSHVLALDHLPLHHKDPFDRLLIAQANLEDATLVSQDEILSSYSVQLIW